MATCLRSSPKSAEGWSQVLGPAIESNIHIGTKNIIHGKYFQQTNMSRKDRAVRPVPQEYGFQCLRASLFRSYIVRAIVTP